MTAVLLVPVTEAVNCCLPLTPTETLSGDRLTCTVPEEIVTAVDPLTEGFVSDVAVIITVAGLGAVPGAVYRPVEDMLPQAMPEQPLPVALQTTMPDPGPLARNWIWLFGFT